MKILSINFGHDAALCLFDNGRLVEFCEIERISRLKHNYGIGSSTLNKFLDRLGLTFAEIDWVVVNKNRIPF